MVTAIIMASGQGTDVSGLIAERGDCDRAGARIFQALGIEPGMRQSGAAAACQPFSHGHHFGELFDGAVPRHALPASSHVSSP